MSLLCDPAPPLSSLLPIGLFPLQRHNDHPFTHTPCPQRVQDYPSGDEVREYVQAYARHFDLYRHVLFSSRLVRLSRRTPSTPKTPSGAATQAPAAAAAEAPDVPGAQVPKFNSEHLPDPNGSTANSLYAGPATGGVGPRHSCPIGMVYGVQPQEGDPQAPGLHGAQLLAQNGPSVCGASGGAAQGPLEVDSGLLRSLSGMPEGAWGAPAVPPGAGDSRHGASAHIMDLHQEAARRSSGVPPAYGKQQQQSQQEMGRDSAATTATGMGATSGMHAITTAASPGMVPPSPVATTAGAVASEASPAGKAGLRQLLLGGMSRGHSGAQVKQQQQQSEKISALHAHMHPPSGSHASRGVIAAHHHAPPGSAGGGYGVTAAGAGAESTATGRVACYPSDIGSDGTPSQCAAGGAGAGYGVSDLGGSIAALGAAVAAGGSAAESHRRSVGGASSQQQQQQQQQGAVQSSTAGKGGVGRNGKDGSASGRGQGALASEMLGGGWVAEYEDLCTGRRYVLNVSFVVLCTGLYASPFIPKIPVGGWGVEPANRRLGPWASLFVTGLRVASVVILPVLADSHCSEAHLLVP